MFIHCVWLAFLWSFLVSGSEIQVNVNIASSGMSNEEFRTAMQQAMEEVVKSENSAVSIGLMAEGLFLNQSLRRYDVNNESLNVKPEGKYHNLSPIEVSESSTTDALMVNFGFPVAPIVRYNHALKPIEPTLLAHPVLKSCIKIISSLEAEAQLNAASRSTLYDELKRGGLFVRETRKGAKKGERKFVVPEKVLRDSKVKYLLASHFCRRSLAMVAPILLTSDVEWLSEVAPKQIAHNHAFLSGLSDFEGLSAEVIIAAADSRFDFTANAKAMQSMTGAGLSALLQARAYQLSFDEWTRLQKARHFKDALKVDPLAWQVFFTTDEAFKVYGIMSQYYRKHIKPRIVSAESMQPAALFTSILALYTQSEAIISSGFFLLGTHFRFQMEFNDGVKVVLENAHEMFALRREMADDLARNGFIQLAELIKTPMNAIIRKALFTADASVASADIFEALKQRISTLNSFENPVADQIDDARVILESFGPGIVPYAFNADAKNCLQMMRLWREALGMGNVRAHTSIWTKIFAMAQVFDYSAFYTVDDAEFLEEALRALSLIPTELFTENEIQHLESSFGSVLGFDSLLETIKANQISPLGPAFPVAFFDCEAQMLLADRERLSRTLVESGFRQFYELVTNEAALESMLSVALSRIDGSVESFLAAATKGQSREFLNALTVVPHVLSRQMISALIGREQGIAFLLANHRILHNLATFEDFELSHIQHFMPVLDLERFGVGLYTLPAPLILYLLSCRHQFVLNDPPAFIWRLNPSVWRAEEMREMFLKSMNLMTLAVTPDLAKEALFHLKGTDLIETMTGKALLCQAMKSIVLWHINQEMRFLEFHGLFFEELLSPLNGVSEKEQESAKMNLYKAFVLHSLGENQAFLSIHTFMFDVLKSLQFDARNTNVLSLVGRVQGLLSQPISDARAVALLAGSKVVDGNCYTAAYSSVAPFTQLFGPFRADMRKVFARNRGIPIARLLLGRKGKVEREKCSQVLHELADVMSPEELALAEARLKILSLISADGMLINDDWTVSEVKKLFSGPVPLSDAQSVIRLLSMSGFVVQSFEGVPDEVNLQASEEAKSVASKVFTLEK